MASLSPLLSVSSYSQSRNQAFSPRNKRRGVNYVPCRASNGDGGPNSQGGDSAMSKFDRRDVLLGLGGIYGVAALSGHRPALAQPLSPDVDHCEIATIVDDGEKGQCCPPKFHDIVDFIPPYISELRVRPAAHLITPKQLYNFERAIDLMKRLPHDDPRNFYRQAEVHCAYCDYAYKQVGFPEHEFQVHWNALFFPFHRAYLYFFEKICGHLIDDPDFAIPFWNWDDIPGMHMPEIYDNPNSPLYDVFRDQRHRPHKLLYLNYDGTEDPGFDVVESNLCWMYQQMITQAKCAEQFHGVLLRGGKDATDDDNHMGTIERSPHNTIHNWVGDPKNTKHGEDMGILYSAARDPLFYGHHANVDRMWNIWQGLKKGRPRDFTDPDWLDSSFVFYNEHKEPVRIKVRDCLDSKRLGYVYQNVCIPWLYVKPKPRPIWIRPPPPSAKMMATVTSFPQVLNSKISTAVKRPKKSRDRKEKSEEDEVLVIEGIELDKNIWVHFNVLVNVVDDGSDVNPGNTEFAGTFTNVPHGHKHRGKTSLRLVITELLEDLRLEDDESVHVMIVPKVGGENVTIEGIKIEYQSKE